jgi:hypothetical protein
MSHVTTVKTVITNLDAIKRTVKELGYASKENASLSGAYVKGQKVDLVIDLGSRSDVGFNKEPDGTYTMVGDFYGLDGYGQPFKDRFMNRYNYLLVMDAINAGAAPAISIDGVNIQQNGIIEIEATINEQVVGL